MKKCKVIIRFLFIGFMFISLIALALSAILLYLGIHFNGLIFTHILLGTVFVLSAIIHFIHRKNKWLKLKTQAKDVIFKNQYAAYCNLDRLYLTFEKLSIQTLAESLDLSVDRIIEELKQGDIAVTDPHFTLREIVQQNDEKLFKAITIILLLKYNNPTGGHQ